MSIGTMHRTPTAAREPLPVRGLLHHKEMFPTSAVPVGADRAASWAGQTMSCAQRTYVVCTQQSGVCSCRLVVWTACTIHMREEPEPSCIWAAGGDDAHEAGRLGLAPDK